MILLMNNLINIIIYDDLKEKYHYFIKSENY